MGMYSIKKEAYIDVSVIEQKEEGLSIVHACFLRGENQKGEMAKLSCKSGSHPSFNKETWKGSMYNFNT